MEIKNTFDRLTGEFNMAEGIISEVGDISLEIPKLKIKIEMGGGAKHRITTRKSITYARWE